MSYFFSGFKNNTDIKGEFEKLFHSILPKKLLNDTIKISDKSSCFMSYGNGKIIPDIMIKNKKGSWLVIIGTPLVQFKNEKEKIEFLEEFLKNPKDALQEKIDGNFSVFSYDSIKDRIILAADINNTIPVFYSNCKNGFIFSSNELVLAKYLNAEINSFGFNQSIHLGVTWGEYTRFKNIYKVLPCQILIIDNKKQVYKDQFWSPVDETVWAGSLDDSIEKWLQILKESVLKYYNCSGEKPVTSDFTAGEDARLIVAQCHAAGIPFATQVSGVKDDDIDIIVAKKAAQKTGFKLLDLRRKSITKEQLMNDAFNIIMKNEGYQEFFKSCIEFASSLSFPVDDYKTIKYCGVPGGEAFRGAYYLRGKALFPSMKVKLDRKFFTKMKFLLDFHPDLMKFSDKEFINSIDNIVKKDLQEVDGYPIGTQIDHMLRIYQTCVEGLKYRNPLYLPFATYKITRSIYNLSPKYKKGGKLTKACTEILYPELAFVKTQKGVPTIRKTFWRFPYFLPEYFSLIKFIYSGAVSRLFKWTQANKWYFSLDVNSNVIRTFLNIEPYSKWFLSSDKMITGHLYNQNILNPLLSEAKTGVSRYVPILGRVINQELAYRWICSDLK